MSQGPLFPRARCAYHTWLLPCWECAREEVVEGDRDGKTYEPARDRVRLGKQAGDVYDVVAKGGWYSLGAIARLTGHPEASISARLRDLRKPRFGGYDVQRRNIGGGTWQYRLRVEEVA